MRSSDRHYAQNFTKSYFSRNDSGEYDVILMEDGLPAAPGKARGPIASTTAAPLSQLMHVHVRWTPASTHVPDAPSATNAVIDWYVRDPASRWDQLHYSGPAFVTIADSGSKARFDVRSSQLSLANSSGDIDDPLGDCALSGTLRAGRNDSMVASTLISIQSDQVQMRAAQASVHEGPPPRAPEP